MDVPIHKAKTDLTKLIPLVEAGERVIITRHGKPVAELAAPSPAGGFSLARIAQIQKARGAKQSGFWMAEDFNDPLPDSVWFDGDDPAA